MTLASKARHGRRVHHFRELTPDRRPQDPTGTGEGWTFQTAEHGGVVPDNMPQAIIATDAEGRSCTYVPITEGGRVVESLGFELEPEN